MSIRADRALRSGRLRGRPASGQRRYADAQQRYDVIGDLPSEVDLLPL